MDGRAIPRHALIKDGVGRQIVEHPLGLSRPGTDLVGSLPAVLGSRRNEHDGPRPDALQWRDDVRASGLEQADGQQPQLPTLRWLVHRVSERVDELMVPRIALE